VSEPVLEMRDVKAAYGRIEVLHGVNLVVPEASVVALLGPNGAGKTTTIKVASGQMRPTAGHVHVAGRHVNGVGPDDLARAGVCTIPDGRGIFPNLSVTENLRMVTFAGKSTSKVLDRSFDVFPKLKQRRHQLAGTMSGGEQQMLALARAVATDPALLMLDEISMGLAPLVVEELYEVIGAIAQEGVSVLLVEQFAQTALRAADYAAIMVQGVIQTVGQPADVADELSGAYLGTGAA
jgi:branched-chain amino acid transport system ATP-binding protein